MKSSHGVFVIPIFLALFLSSCYDELYKPIPETANWNPNFALPLVTKTFTIEKSLVLEGIPQINLDLDVPEWAKYVNITLTDTVPFVLADITNEADNIRFIEFKIKLENDFPSNGEIQLYFIDSNGLLLDVLFNESPLSIVSSDFNDNGEIISRGKSQTFVAFTPQRIETISSATQVVPVARITNLDVPVFLFSHYESYSFTFTLSVRVGLSIPI